MGHSMDHPASTLRHLVRILLAAAALIGSAASSSGQAGAPSAPVDSRIPALLEELGRVRAPVTAAISPDGNTVAWTVNGHAGSELHLTGLAPSGGERVLSPDTAGGASNNAPGVCNASHPAWSPDGKQLAFLSGCSGSAGNWQHDSQDNIFVWTVATNDLKPVSHLHGAISDLQWSPDGKTIAFLFVENATRRAGALDAMKPWNGVIGEDGFEVQRIAGVDVQSGGAGWISADPMLHVYEFSWSPDSQIVTYIAAAPPGENNWWVAKLYAQTVERSFCSLPIRSLGSIPECSEVMKIILENVLDPTKTPGPLHGLQIAIPRFSPDGKQIAFIGGLMSDQGSTGGDIYLIPATGLKSGEAPRDITPNRPASPAWIAWRNDHSLLVSEHAGGSSHITAIDSATGRDDPGLNLTLPDSIIAGADAMSISTSHTENVALIRQSFERPPEVWAGPLDHLKQISHLNDAAKPAWGKSESIEYTNGGLPIQGWLLYPAGWNANDGKKYPLIVSVHGGPGGAVTPRWPGVDYGPIPFSALGYFVFMPNPRGSFGQGETFTQANVRDFGYGDLRDVLAGVDVIEKHFPVDKEREGITGWSYGGFMTMFAVTQTTRFKAAVAGAGIANWQSYYGENSIDQWMVPFFGGTVYDEPAAYARSSPIDFVERARTPTLLVVGDRDGECPAPQSFEFWHGLRTEGVKTQLVVYPDEGHHFRDPEHRRDVLERALEWFETEMPGK